MNIIKIEIKQKSAGQDYYEEHDKDIKQIKKELNDDLGECHKCEECNKVFRTNARLKEHVITHTGDKPFKRNHCDKQYNLKPNLRKNTKNFIKI